MVNIKPWHELPLPCRECPDLKMYTNHMEDDNLYQCTRWTGCQVWIRATPEEEKESNLDQDILRKLAVQNLVSLGYDKAEAEAWIRSADIGIKDDGNEV